MIPNAAKTVRVDAFLNGLLVQDKVGDIDATSPNAQTLDLSTLPTGVPLTFVVTFYASTNGTGVPLATAVPPATTINPGENHIFDINASGQIDHLLLTTIPASLGVPMSGILMVAPATTLSVLVTAYDINNNIVPFKATIATGSGSHFQIDDLAFDLTNANLLTSVKAADNGILTIVTGNVTGDVVINVGVASGPGVPAVPAVPPLTIRIVGIKQIVIKPQPPLSTLPTSAEAGDQFNLIADAEDADGHSIVYNPKDNLTWSTDQSNKATVAFDPNNGIGVVTVGLEPSIPIGADQVHITAKLDNPAVSGMYALTTTGITDLEIVPDALSSTHAHSVTLTAFPRNSRRVRLPFDPMKVTFRWVSADTAQATVPGNATTSRATVTASDSNADLTPVTPNNGNVRITATMKTRTDDPGKSGFQDFAIVPNVGNPPLTIIAR